MLTSLWCWPLVCPHHISSNCSGTILCRGMGVHWSCWRHKFWFNPLYTWLNSSIKVSNIFEFNIYIFIFWRMDHGWMVSALATAVDGESFFFSLGGRRYKTIHQLVKQLAHNYWHKFTPVHRDMFWCFLYTNNANKFSMCTLCIPVPEGWAWWGGIHN